MALIFKVGEHSDFSPVPHNFPKCGDYFDSAAVGRNKTGREIDFKNGITYNVTVEQNKDEDNFISFSHWWPLNSTFAASDAVRYNQLSSLLLSVTVTISLLFH